MTRFLGRLGLALGFLVSANGCGSSDADSKPNKPACDYEAQTGCEGGQVCEQVEGASDAKTGCFAPVLVEGRVVRSDAPDQGIEGARVVGRDENGAPVSRAIAVSEADGSYTLQVPAPRDASGKPSLPELLLRADAAGFASFPSGLRVAIPVDLTSPKTDDHGLHVVNDTTTVALDALPDADTLGSVSGKVLADAAAGTLVVAGGASAIADADGSYVVFNVPTGDVEVRGYAAGLSLEAASAAVSAGKQTKGVDLAESKAALGSVQGDLSFVNASASTTSVVLVVKSTFNATLKRGEVPRGLRAFPVTGKYSFKDVPAGDYVVLAAFENDDLVRDPDESIGGTAIQEITVKGAPVDVPGFKITGALGVVSPGAKQPEVMGPSVTFKWEDDSSEDGYELTVLDTFGNEVWKDSDVPRVTGSAVVSLAYGGPALDPGYYQFRVVSWRSDKKSAARTYISATEDLKGVFIIE